MKNIEFIEKSLILTYLSDYLEDLSVADPVSEVRGFTIYEFDKKQAIDTVLNNLSENDLLKKSIMKDENNWKIRIFKDQDHIPLDMNGKFYVAYDKDLIPFEDSNYFESLEEAKNYIDETYNKCSIFCDITYEEPEIVDGEDLLVTKVIDFNSKEFLDHPIRKDFVQFLQKNNIIIKNGWLSVDCEKEKDKINYLRFSLGSGQILSGDFSNVEEVNVHDKCIIRNGKFKDLMVTNNIIVQNATSDYINAGTSLFSEDIDNCPVIYNGDYKVGKFWVCKVLNGTFDTAVCFSEFAKLYNCNINNFVLVCLPENFNKFKGNINNVIVLPETIDLFKSTPKLFKMAKKVYLYNTNIDDLQWTIPYKLDEMFNNLKELDKKELKKKSKNNLKL